MTNITATRCFRLDDNANFALLSGDANPVHTDPVSARRTIFGGPVVHAVHGVLWALDEAGSAYGQNAALTRLGARFDQPIRVGQPVTCRVSEESEGRLRLELESLGRLACRVDCSFAPHGAMTLPNVAESAPQGPRTCKDRAFEEIAGLHGELAVDLIGPEFAGRFPRLSAFLPAGQLAALLATTRLVGMECPGLHSIFLGMDLEFLPVPKDCGALHFTVKAVHNVTGRIVIAVDCTAARGEVIAAYRPRPAQQISYETAQCLVTRGEFTGQRAVVIGGSRGLGEVAAKLVAAGGGRVWLSYASGKADGLRVRDEIRAGGGDAQTFCYDVTRADCRLTDALPRDWDPTHLYYFATPYISLNETTEFVEEVFQMYVSFYLLGFRRVFREAQAKARSGLRVLYPSSAAVDEVLPKAAEYASAKAAGETLCAHLEKAYRNVRILRPRFPRLLTDQTASLMPAESADAPQVLLEAIRMLA